MKAKTITSDFISANIDIENLSRLAKDIVSNQQVDDDIQMHKFEMLERFGTSNIYMNRHDRRVAKAKCRKQNKRRCVLAHLPES